MLLPIVRFATNAAEGGMSQREDLVQKCCLARFIRPARIDESAKDKREEIASVWKTTRALTFSSADSKVRHVSPLEVFAALAA